MDLDGADVRTGGDPGLGDRPRIPTLRGTRTVTGVDRRQAQDRTAHDHRDGERCVTSGWRGPTTTDTEGPALLLDMTATTFYSRDLLHRNLTRVAPLLTTGVC